MTGGQVRIIGGAFRGKHIRVLDQSTLRPTPNRVRETLFNWLMHDIRRYTCLDAFAGSGALGLEGFSRGAQEVVLIENDPLVFKQLQQTLKTFPSESPLSCHQMSFFEYLAKTRVVFDLVFLDPPFQETLLPQCLEELSVSIALKPGGLVYLESDQPLPEAPDWEILKSSKAASLYFGLYKKNFPSPLGEKVS